MSMCADIIAIGPYSKSIVEFMEYPETVYASTRDGAILTRRLFGIYEGSSLSREFATLFGINDPWDFNQHQIDNSKINIPGLRAFVQLYEQYDHDLVILEALIGAGFELHFCPNG
jgi:hypothetical protein